MPNNKNVITVFILLGIWITARANINTEMGESMHGADKIMHANHKCTEDQPGKNCSAVCPIGTHGDDCALNCSIHCVYRICDKFYGNCSHGCQYGWEGDYCEVDLLTPEELKEQAIIMFFEFIAGIMGFYLLQIAVIKYRSLNIGCCCCCKYCPCNKDKREKKKRLKKKLQERRDAAFVVELEPLNFQSNNKLSQKQMVHVV